MQTRPERAAGRGLRIRRAARPCDRAPTVADPGAGDSGSAAGAVRPVAGAELRLPALRPRHRRAAHPRAPLEPGAAQAGVPPRLAEALAGAGAAQAVCAPVVAVLSARVSLVAVPCNLLAEFAVAPATVLGFAALATAPVAMPVAGALAWGASWPAGWIVDIARTGAALPGGGVDWPGSWTGALLLGLCMVLVVFVGARLLKHPWWCAACGVLLLLVVVRPAPLTRVITGWPPPGWRYAMCDVGQGDATVLAAGGRHWCRR